MKPHPKNSCGGNFSDWLEVYLTKRCNGKCRWCVDKRGWSPDEASAVSWFELAGRIVDSSAQNIILLGGEPTLYKDLGPLIYRIRAASKNVYLTTNGSKLNPDYIGTLRGLTGINISIHSFALSENFEETGIRLDKANLIECISMLHGSHVGVRLNCNCMKERIDTIEKVYLYIDFAKEVGADSVRLAEMKFDDDRFVSLAEIFRDANGSDYGLNEDPYALGCNNEAIVRGMKINFRQMCGLQTKLRPIPSKPETKASKTVLYFNGEFYDGWQQKEDESVEKLTKSQKSKMTRLLKKLERNEISVEEAALQIEQMFASSVKKINEEHEKDILNASAGCRY